MKIKKDELLSILETSRMAVAGSDHLEQLGHFIFEGNNLITFNNRLLIYYPLKTDFTCSIRSELFYKQLQKFETPDLDIKLVENRLEIKGTKEKAKLAATLQRDQELFSTIESIRQEALSTEYVPVPAEFIKAVDFCSYSASKNAADGTLCCVCIKGTTVLSTDNYRATRYVMDKPMSDKDLLLDARIANEIKKFKMTEFGVGQNWLHFKNKEGVILSARQIFGDFMDISNAFDFKGKRMRLPPNTVEILDFVSVVLASDQQLERLADISIKNGHIKATVNKPHAVVEKSVPLKVDRYNDLDFLFRINVDFFKSVLEHTPNMIFETEIGRAMFKSPNFEHCIRLMPDIKTPEDVVKEIERQREEEPEQNYESGNEDDDIPF